MGRRDNDVDKRQAVCFHPEIFYQGKKFYMVYIKKYTLVYVVTFCYSFTIPFAHFCASFMNGGANICRYLHTCLEKELQQNRKEA